jgi:hypothetical protein
MPRGQSAGRGVTHRRPPESSCHVPLPRSSLSTEFVLPGPTRARFPGRVSRSTGHASSIRSSLDRARNKANEAPETADRGLIRAPRRAPPLLWREHEVPDGAGSVVHISPERKAPTLRRGSAVNLFQAPRDHPPCGTPRPEGTLFASLCLYHKAPTTATNWTRFALGAAGQDQGPSDAPVEGCADTGPALSSPDTAGWHHDDGA